MSLTTTPADVWLSTSYYVSSGVGLLTFIFGITGNLLNIIVFLSLQTFRKNPCAFCLLVLSISESGFLFFSVLPGSISNILNGVGDVNNPFSCKMRMPFPQIFGLMSQIIMCIASIDQAISTSMPERHYGLKMKTMKCLITGSVVISILHGIPFLIYYDVKSLYGTNATICRIDDNTGAFSSYAIYVSLPFVDGFIPIIIMSVSGLIAVCNIRSMKKKKIHIARLHLEKQLTAMVLIKLLSIYVTVVPFITFYCIRYVISFDINNAHVQAQLLATSYLFIVPFRINYAVSPDKFRSNFLKFIQTLLPTF